MLHRKNRTNIKNAIELLEESVYLLRLGPTTLAGYYAGSLPFVLAMLYFWADMSRSPFAAKRAFDWAVVLACAFVWMKCWHGVFMQQLLAQLTDESPRRWTLRRIFHHASTQAIIQPFGLIALPLAFLAMLPLAWVYAFYQNCTLLELTMERPSTRQTMRLALRQAVLWPRQNNMAIAALFLFGMIVLVNVIHAMFLPPWLLKKFLGVDTIFTMGGFNPLNSTFLAIALGITYLVVDPIVKAFYTLRCFYGRSLHTGQDLKIELRRLTPATGRMAIVCLLLAIVLGVCCSTVQAVNSDDLDMSSDINSPSELKSSTLVSNTELDESIRRVISRPQYAWRHLHHAHHSSCSSGTCSAACLAQQTKEELYR